jgi:hypothetical protein
MSFAGLGVALGGLFTPHREIAFRDARVAVAILGQQLYLDQTAAGYFQKHLQEGTSDGANVPTVEEAFAQFAQGVAAAEAIGVQEKVSGFVPDAAHLDFGGLKQLVYASMEAKQPRC